MSALLYLLLSPPFASEAVLHLIEGIGAITPAYLKPPKCVEQVAHNALLLLFGSRSQDGRFHNAFKWHITGRSLTGLPTTILPGAKEEQQAAAVPFSPQRKRKGGMFGEAQRGIMNHLLTTAAVCFLSTSVSNRQGNTTTQNVSLLWFVSAPKSKDEHFPTEVLR